MARGRTGRVDAQLSLERAVRLYLVGRAGAPGVSLAEDLASQRIAAAQARADIFGVLRRWRESVSLL